MRTELIISGHQRSGTTLLRRVCDSHPQMKVANEFGCFADVGVSVRQATAARLAQWHLVNGRWAYDSRYATHPRRHWHNLWFTLNYCWRLTRLAQGKVTLFNVSQALQKQWRDATVIGDKLPQYMPLLPHLINHERVKAVVIYRDCRDVTSSFLEKVRTVWQSRAWATQVDTAEKIAHNWVSQIELMEQLAGQIYIIQYEAFVQQPAALLQGLGNWLDVDPSGFRPQMANPDRIGKFRQGLTDIELADIWSVAGPTMKRLGYT